MTSNTATIQVELLHCKSTTETDLNLESQIEELRGFKYIKSSLKLTSEFV